ncbi:MAG: hypothetical protein J6L00_02220, partial [Clostridia bacterium]|nr:hypothetical protein [Clostridia bacterium]
KLWGEEDKDVLMGREIAAFAHWIQNGADDTYVYHKALALDVCDCMFAIRQAAGITFPADNVTSRD